MHSTPASLLVRLRQPNEGSAWDRFVELYSPLLFHWAKNLVRQEADAADLVQEAFLLLWRTLPEFQYSPTKSFHGWLRTLFLNRARQRMRERSPATSDKDWDDLADSIDNVAEETEYRHFLVHHALRLIEHEFSAQHLRAFREYVLAEKPVEEVAKRLGLSRGTIYCVKSRILNRLRHELRDLL